MYSSLKGTVSASSQWPLKPFVGRFLVVCFRKSLKLVYLVKKKQNKFSWSFTWKPVKFVDDPKQSRHIYNTESQEYGTHVNERAFPAHDVFFT